MFSIYLYMLIFLNDFRPGNWITDPIPVPNFCYPNPDPVETESWNLQPILNLVRLVPGPNRIRIQDWVPDFFLSPTSKVTRPFFLA